MIELTAAGGVLFRESGEEVSVLLIYRKGVWDLPKGKLEEGETLEECAIREVAEEIGCKLPTILGKLAKTYHEYNEGGEEIGKTTHWYAMETSTTSNFVPQELEGIEKIRWVNIRKAKEILGYQNLLEVLKAFNRWYGKKQLNS